jgi:Rrf2 family protein
LARVVGPSRNFPTSEREVLPRRSTRGMEKGLGCLNRKRWTPRICSRWSAYAICALVRMARLARYSAGKYRHVTEIVGRDNRPRQCLAKILQRLSSEGILQSRRGSSGGFAFRLAADKIDLLKIVCAIDGGIPCFERCALGYARCSGQHPCEMHESWQAVRECIRRFLKQTIAGLAETRSPGPAACGENGPAPPPDRGDGDTVRNWLRSKARTTTG